jgi:hypothetical protein
MIDEAVTRLIRESLSIVVDETVEYGPRRRVTVRLLWKGEEISHDWFEMEEGR